MDPFSIPALCVTSSKILLGMYEYIKDIVDVPHQIEDLSTELCAFNTALTGLRSLITKRKDSHRELISQWANDSKNVLDGCCGVLEEIDAMIKKAKNVKSKLVGGELVTRIKWLWDKEEVLRLQKRLEAYKSTISMMQQNLNGEQLDSLADVLDKFHKCVLELQEGKHVKKTLVVMDTDHPQFKEAEFTLTHNPVKKQKPSEPQGTSPNPQPLNKQLLDELESSSWTPSSIRCDGEKVPLLLNCRLRIVIRHGKIACLEILLQADLKENLEKLHREHIGDYLAGFALRLFRQTALFPSYFKPYQKGFLSFEFLFTKITRVDKLNIEISPGEHRWRGIGRSYQGNLGLKFDSVSDADDVFRLLQSVEEELEFSWKMHTQSFLNVDRGLRSDSEELLAGAVEEEYKWATYLRGYSDSWWC